MHVHVMPRVHRDGVKPTRYAAPDPGDARAREARGPAGCQAVFELCAQQFNKQRKRWPQLWRNPPRVLAGARSGPSPSITPEFLLPSSL